MRDKQKADYTLSTGPDRYFEESLQYPTFHKALPSSFSIHIDRKYALHRSSSSLNKSLDKENVGLSPFVTIPKRNLWRQISKRTNDSSSPTDSPGSEGTHKTSECSTDSDNDDNDLDSHCGSLTYSVESFALGHNFLSAEEFDEGYHAEDEGETTTLGCSFADSSFYADDADNRNGDFDDGDDGDDDCFTSDPCSLLFGGVQSWFQDRNQRLESSPHRITHEDYKSSMRYRGHLFQEQIANQRL